MLQCVHNVLAWHLAVSCETLGVLLTQGCFGLQVAAHQSGSLVYKIDPLAPAHEVLKENDVVMEIDSVPIADDGTVEFRNEERVEFSHIVRAKHIGELCVSGQQLMAF